MCSQIIFYIYIYIYIYIQDLALDNLQWLICYKTQPISSHKITRVIHSITWKIAYKWFSEEVLTIIV